MTAARYAPKFEDALEQAMLKRIARFEKLAGSTGLVVDVSGSMNYKLSKKGETTRMDAAAGLAILLRERPGISRLRPSPMRASNSLRGVVSRCGTPLWAPRRTRGRTSSAL